VYEDRHFFCTANIMSLRIMFSSFKEEHLKSIQYNEIPLLDNSESVTYYLIMTYTLQLACSKRKSCHDKPRM